MADPFGLVKLSDALQWFRLVALYGWELRRHRVELNIRLTDHGGDTMDTIGHIDGPSSIVWVQLPLLVCNEIVCQGGAAPRADDLDARFLATHAEPPPIAPQEATGAATRRANLVHCAWHQGAKLDRTRDHFAATRCDACGRWYRDRSPIVHARILGVPDAGKIELGTS